MGRVHILLKQHVGVPCKAVTELGADVQRGTLIAVPDGLGANIFSSVCGVVESVTDTEIVIRKKEEQPESYVKIPEGTKAEMVAYAGITGMGGAGFPTAVKLSADLHGGYILVNAAECEPGLCHNIRQIEEQCDKIIRGVKYCMELTNASKAIFAIKKKNEKAVRVVRECLGVELGVDQLPTAADAVVINVETVSRVAEAIDERKPCFSKNVTVVGKLNGGEEPHVFLDVPIGTSIGELIERAGGINGIYGEIIVGGPFTGHAAQEDTPVTKTTGGVIVTIDLPDLHGAPVGLLVCACGGTEERMRDICAKMNGKVVSVARCKQAVEMKNGALKCERPGNCPGQVKNSIQFKKDGCEYIIIGNCSDCSNTVMGSAPKMGLKVFHQTDHVMRTIHHPLYRHLRVSKKVEQDI